MADIICLMYIFLDTAKAGDFAIDHDQLLNLAETFVSSLQNDLSSLEDAMAAADVSALKRLLHTLKGYVTFLCSDHLANQLIHIESSARELTAEQLQPHVHELLPALKNMHHEVIDWRDQLLPQQK
jgi:HPt (histidine-containing phosphotransfer) domain-containing protein